MSFRLTIVVLLVAFVGFWHNYQVIENRTISEIEKYVKERAERESVYFGLAERNLELFAQTFEKELLKNNRDYQWEFSRLVKKHKNGTYGQRSNSEPIQIFLKKGVAVTPQIEKNVVILNKLLKRFGHSWSANFTNVWAAGIEDYGATYWPSRPTALSNLPIDHSFLNQEYMVIGLPENNPRGERRWSGPYFDIMSKDWMISLNRPIYFQGKYILSVGMDILLNDFHDRAIGNVLEGTFNLVFREDGRLITHPRYMDDIKKSDGNFFIHDKGDQKIKDTYKLVTSAVTSVVEDKKNGNFLGVGRIKGPDWFFVLVFPKNNLLEIAKETAIFLVILGFLSLLVELMMLYQVITNYVKKPIEKLTRASEKIAAGDFYSRVEIDSEDEIGQLASSFNYMGEEVLKRDKQLSEQASRLEIEVQKRGHELDMQRAKSFQAAKMATLGEITSGIAHEINNPLATITLSAGAIRKRLEKGALTEEQLLPYLKKIEDTTQRISKIVKGLRSFSRSAESDSRSPILLSVLIDETFTLCEETLKKQNVTIHCEEIPKVEVLCRESEIIQTLLNLIQNAIDAMVSVPHKIITVSFNESSDYISLLIHDNGVLISEEVQEKMMNPFFTTKEIGKGTGLGLFISCGLVESNGGKLTFEQNQTGKKFIVTLVKAK